MHMQIYQPFNSMKTVFSILQKQTRQLILEENKAGFFAGNVFNLKHNRALESPWMKKQNTTTLDLLNMLEKKHIFSQIVVSWWLMVIYHGRKLKKMP